MGICVLLLGLVAGNLFSEVYFLHDGEVVLGTLLKAGSGSVTIRTMGTERTVDSGGIIRTETSLAALNDMLLEVRLKDGTVLSGKLVDFDEEIGLFFDIGFGSIAVPASAIESIRDTKRVAEYAGKPLVIGLAASAFFPLEDEYSLSWGGTVFAEYRTTLLRGLYAGLGITWERLDYEPSSAVTFDILSLSGHLTYKFFGLGDSLPVLSFIIPYVKVGGGAALVQVEDSRASEGPTDKKEFTSTAKAEVGIEWRLPKGVSLRSFGAASAVFQESGVFVQPEAGLGLLYGF